MVAWTKNGRLRSTRLRSQSEADVADEFTCHNPNWTEEVTDVTTTDFTYTVTFAGFTEPAIDITGL
jgi:hypothetical protein